MDGGDAACPRARCLNLDESLYAPVARGLWRQHEIWDGTYTLDDLLDINEMILVQQENTRRAELAKGGADPWLCRK